MKDENKTKEQLLNELEELRQRIAELKTAETERKQIEEERDSLATFPELNPEPVIEVDLTGNVVYINTAAQRKFPGLGTEGPEHPILRALRSTGYSPSTAKRKLIVTDTQVGKRTFRQRIYYNRKSQSLRSYIHDITAQLKAEALKERAFQKTREASLDTIYRLSRAAEYRDEGTGAHIKRMSYVAEAVARKMGLDENIVENIQYAAPMHDVGKIGIPDRILLKPGKLDSAEWEIMKQHTTIGARILKGSNADFIKLAEVIARTHHEKWDGSGYPEGLQGADIPLAGRIVAIADVFDALTSKRPYKEAFSIEKSLNIVREARGKHFDPDVVDAFFAIEDEVLEIRERYKDSRKSLLIRMARL